MTWPRLRLCGRTRTSFELLRQDRLMFTTGPGRAWGAERQERQGLKENEKAHTKKTSETLSHRTLSHHHHSSTSTVMGAHALPAATAPSPGVTAFQWRGGDRTTRAEAPASRSAAGAGKLHDFGPANEAARGRSGSGGGRRAVGWRRRAASDHARAHRCHQGSLAAGREGSWRATGAVCQATTVVSLVGSGRGAGSCGVGEGRGGGCVSVHRHLASVSRASHKPQFLLKLRLGVRGCAEHEEWRCWQILVGTICLPRHASLPRAHLGRHRRRCQAAKQAHGVCGRRVQAVFDPPQRERKLVRRQMPLFDSLDTK